MIIVADSSPLISFAIIEQLSLLQKLFSNIILPETVFRESTMHDKPYSNLLRTYFEHNIVKVKDRLIVQVLSNSIDLGEAEAIALGLEQKINNILIDDYKGRQQALLNGLQPIGTIGVLIQAKRTKLIDAIKPLLDKLIQHEIRISTNLYQKALVLANE